MKTIFTRDLAKNQLHVTREFAAPVDAVWTAWTDPKLLEQWWAPLPYKAITHSMDFRIGGTWLYYMLGPDQSKGWCRVDYTAIEKMKKFVGNGAFCDENGAVSSDLPQMTWEVRFLPSTTGTRVEVLISFAQEADLLKIVELGFEQGFTMAHENLDHLLTA